MKQQNKTRALLALPLVLALLASCGGGSDDAPPPGTGEGNSNWDQITWDQDDWA